MLPLCYESDGLVQSPMEQVFAHIDDHNEKEIAKPPSVGFDTAPVKPAGPGSGASK